MHSGRTHEKPFECIISLLKLDREMLFWKTGRPADKILMKRYIPGMETWNVEDCVPPRSYKSPAPDILFESKRMFPSCECADAWVYAWYVPYKYMEACEHVIAYHAEHHKKTTHKGNGKYLGPFAFTLTKSPKDKNTVADMLQAIRKIINQKSQPLVRWAWYYEDKGRDEYGDAIHPHIHGMYETANGRRLEIKHFKRAWDLWDENMPLGAGFKGGYHRPVKSEEKYDDYIKKDGGMGGHS